MHLSSHLLSVIKEAVLISGGLQMNTFWKKVVNPWIVIEVLYKQPYLCIIAVIFPAQLKVE